MSDRMAVLEYSSVAFYTACDVMSVTSLVGQTWATSVSGRQVIGLWSYCYHDDTGDQPETRPTCSSTDKVDNLGWLDPVRALLTLGFVLTILSTLAVSGDVLRPVLQSRRTRLRPYGNCSWCQTFCRPCVYVTVTALAAVAHAVGNVLFGHGIDGLKLSSQPVGGGQSSESLTPSWCFILSACATGLLLLAVSLIVAARLILTPDRQLSENTATASDGTQPEVDGSHPGEGGSKVVNAGPVTPEGPPIRFLRFSLSFPSLSRSTSTTAISIPTVDQLVADHEL